MRLLGRVAILAFAFCAMLGSGIVVGSAQAANEPGATVKDFYATLTQTMQRGPQLDQTGRYHALAPAIRADFDLSAMAQRAVGPSWASLSVPQREAVTQAFARYIIATYAENFKTADGKQLQVGGERAMPYGTVVETAIVQPDGDRTSVNYLMQQKGNHWQVEDIYLQGTISQVANLRSQFTAVIQRGGAEALVNTLNQKTASLLPNSAAS